MTNLTGKVPRRVPPSKALDTMISLTPKLSREPPCRVQRISKRPRGDVDVFIGVIKLSIGMAELQYSTYCVVFLTMSSLSLI